MNPNPMGGMPNGMMGMMPNAQMNPNMARPQGMAPGSSWQGVQQLLFKQYHSIDRAQLPGGWQQTHNPTERAKHALELITMLRTISPNADLSNHLQVAHGTEDRAFRESATKENYNNAMQQRKMHLQQRRQINASNIQQSLQQNAHLMGPQQHMFPQGQQPQQQQQPQAMQMPNGMPNHFGGSFNGQNPRPGQMQAPQGMGAQLGQMPGSMAMGNQGAMGQPMNSNPSQLTQQELAQISVLAQRMYQGTSADQLQNIRQNMARTMSPQQRMQLGNGDPAQIVFRQRATQLMLQQKAQKMGQMPQKMGMPQFNSNMQNPGGAGAPGFDPSADLDFLAKQDDARKRQARGELVVPPSNPLSQRPGSAQMGSGIGGFSVMGNQFVNQGQATPGQSRPGQQPGPSPLLGGGINVSGPGAMNNGLVNINQPFPQPSSSPQVPQQMPQMPGQMGQQPQKMPTQQEIQQMHADLQTLPQQVRDAFANKSTAQQWLLYQSLKSRQMRMARPNVQGNQHPGQQQHASHQPNQQPQQQPPQQAQQPGQPGKQPPTQSSQQQPQMTPMNPDQEKKMDEFNFPLETIRKIIPTLPHDLRKWNQLKAWATTQRLSPQQMLGIKRYQVMHFMQLNSAKRPGQPGSAALGPSGATANGVAADATGNLPGPIFLSDAQCDEVRKKNPQMAHMNNDDIRKRWAAAQQLRMQQQKLTGQVAHNPNAPPLQNGSTQGQASTAKPAPPSQNQNQTQNQNQAQASQKAPVKKPSNDDVVEVPNPNLPKAQSSSQPQVAKKANQAQTEGTPSSGQPPRPSSQAPSMVNQPLTQETMNKYRQWRGEMLASLPRPAQATYSAHQRQSVDGVLMGSLHLISKSDQFLMMNYQYCDLDKTPKEREAETKKLIQMSLLVRRQFDTSGPQPKVVEHLTLDYLPLAGSLTKLKQVFHKVAALRAPRQAEQPGAPAQAGPPGQQKFKAPQAPMTEPQRKASAKRPSKDQPPPAPTDEKSGFSFQNAQGIPQYPPGAKPFDQELHLPTSKKRKVGLAGTPVPSPPTSSPHLKEKSPRAQPEKAFKCKQTGCENSKMSFASKEELQKHLDTAHEEPMPEDPLEYALAHMRKAWNLNDDGKSKTAASKDKAGGIPMSRAATGANSNAPRTPQSMSTTGGNSKPATPAMQAGKLPAKQVQGPLTPPQDLWIHCSITAQSVAEILPVPLTDILASLTPDSKTSPETGDATDKLPDKDHASPKTPKASEAMQLDSIQVKDVAIVDSKSDSLDFDFDFGGGMGPWENGMYGTAEALSGGAYGGSLEDFFGGDNSFNGTGSWDDFTASDNKTSGKATVAPKVQDGKKGSTGTKSSAAVKSNKSQEDDWAKAFEMAFD